MEEPETNAAAGTTPTSSAGPLPALSLADFEKAFTLLSPPKRRLFSHRLKKEGDSRELRNAIADALEAEADRNEEEADRNEEEANKIDQEALRLEEQAYREEQKIQQYREEQKIQQYRQSAERYRKESERLTDEIISRQQGDPGVTLRTLSSELVLLPVIYLILAIVEASSYVWRPISVLLYSALLLLALFLLVLNLWSASEERLRKHSVLVRSHFSTGLAAAIVMLISFSQLSRHLHILFGGFTADRPEYWHWLRYGFSTLLDGVTFGAPSLYNWTLTEIQPTLFWSQTLTLLFTASLQILVIASVWRNVQLAQAFWQTPASAAGDTYLARIMPKLAELLVLAFWGIPTAVGIGAVVNDGLYWDSSMTAVRLIVPSVLGLWLAAQSTRALMMLLGRRSKLAAFFGMAIGVALVLANLSDMLTFFGN